MGQIIYPKYAVFIVVYAICFLFVGTSIARGLDKLFPRFNRDKKKEKSKARYVGEITLQITLIVLGTYFFREIIDHIFKSIKAIKVHMYGNPDRFAAIIIAPVMFTVQPNLTDKIEYVWGL